MMFDRLLLGITSNIVKRIPDHTTPSLAGINRFSANLFNDPNFFRYLIKERFNENIPPNVDPKNFYKRLVLKERMVFYLKIVLGMSFHKDLFKNYLTNHIHSDASAEALYLLNQLLQGQFIKDERIDLQINFLFFIFGHCNAWEVFHANRDAILQGIKANLTCQELDRVMLCAAREAQWFLFELLTETETSLSKSIDANFDPYQDPPITCLHAAITPLFSNDTTLNDLANATKIVEYLLSNKASITIDGVGRRAALFPYGTVKELCQKAKDENEAGCNTKTDLQKAKYAFVNTILDWNNENELQHDKIDQPSFSV